MNSPFIDLPVRQSKSKSLYAGGEIRSPFVDISSVSELPAQSEAMVETSESTEPSEAEYSFEGQIQENNETEQDENFSDAETLAPELYMPGVEHQVPPPPQNVKIGDATLTVADSTIDQSDEYRESVPSGNPLLQITPAAAKQRISPNFLVGEYARANAGQFQFKYARIHPALVLNVQRLRTFISRAAVIVDGYYSPKYLRETLGVKIPAKIARDPHIKGHAVKLSVNGFDEKMLDIAVAAIVACDCGTQIRIGNSSIELCVLPPADEPQFSSYLKDEKVGQQFANFCNQFYSIRHKQISNYADLMQKITGALLVTILQLYYGVPTQGFANKVADLVSIMHKETEPSDVYIILYCLAYSRFGNLYRQFLNDKSAGAETTVQILFDIIKGDESSQYQPFLDAQKKSDKKEFITLCYERYVKNYKDMAANIDKSVKSFFDWRNRQGDKVFFDEVLKIVKETYTRNRYTTDIPAQQLPEGGTKHHLEKAAPKPDAPTVDFTGRYYAELPSDPQLFGRYLVVNQAGNYISGKFGDIKKNGGGNTLFAFYGKLDDKGNAIIPFVPQQTIILKKDRSNQVQFSLISNATNTLKLQQVFIQRSIQPVISKQAVDAFKKLNAKNMEVILTLAWVQPLPSQLKEYFQKLKSNQPKIEAAITQYYSIEDTPSVRKNKVGGPMGDLNLYYSYITSSNFRQFFNYYTFFFYSFAFPWRPADDKPFMSKLEWIRKMLEDYRGLTDNKVSNTYQNLYGDFNVPMRAPDIEYEYDVSLRLTSYGVGPFAYLSGTINIENKTDYKKYPTAHRWSGSNKVSYSVSFWNASITLEPIDKWGPKLSEKLDVSASGKSNIAYLESDFSGALIEITEATLFEVTVGNPGVSGSVTERKVIITGLGKGELYLDGSDRLIPDTVTAKPKEKEEKFFEVSGPGLGFYRGGIDTKSIFTMIASVPLPSQFDADYQMQSSTYFQHDSALLSPAGIEAIGRMCAEEFIALSNPTSKLDIVGYADASGDPNYNKQLSEYRAINTLTAIKDRMGSNLKISISTPVGLGEEEANKKYGQYTEKNAWLRRVIVTINGRAVLSLN